MNEADVRLKLIDPALKKAGWNLEQISAEYCVKIDYEFSNGQILFEGKNLKRGEKKKADYVLKHTHSNINLAVIEAKKSSLPANEGLSQAKQYAKALDIQFAYSSNGSSFVEYDFFTGKIRELAIHEFPSPQELWQRYKDGQNITQEQERLISIPYFLEEKEPRYYQTNAINKTIQAIAQGQKKILLVLATGTGKTYVAFQIAHRLYKAKKARKILYLADRNILIDQSIDNDFKPFEKITTIKKIQNHEFDPAYELYFGLYQQFISGSDEESNKIEHYKALQADFFDLIFIDECHRGSAKADSLWREILEYFSPSIQIGMTATPKHDTQASNLDYFGKPLYMYSLKQGIEDGFLAPYKVIRYNFNIDINGYKPEKGKKDKEGNPIPKELYESPSFNREIYIEERTKLVAKIISDFLKYTLKDRYAKTIVFCQDTIHAADMRDALINENSDIMQKEPNYICRITGNDEVGKKELFNFKRTDKTFPVIATTSKLLSTGVDTKMLKLIAIDSHIQSLTEFKQIIGRGTRIDEDLGKSYFVILDFTGATKLFSDPEFDGESFTNIERKIQDKNECKNIDDIDFPTQEPNTENEKIAKRIRVDGVQTYIVHTLEQIIDKDGTLISTDFKEYTKSNLIKHYDIQAFIQKWHSNSKKSILLQEFEENGILIEELRAKEEFKDLDEFDILLKLCFDMPSLSRKERAKNVSKLLQNYEGKAKEILSILLEQYASFGITNIENIDIFSNEPFKSKFGGNIQSIINAFGDISSYKDAINELKYSLYQVS
ncbi:EcoAI/FtnUII family type I restriction enzme subunit R [Helicobacter pullorum]|uniref:EcoAI/FtnUII family type I restriction enzme subunit R n=1 Tax=Helicobacter pullorum TaxID=35818 RepID=UPI001DE56645|nr:DEAD/DEAH box helicase family protein [Helicobacter pullorum]HJF83902.1 DEAD/DEAH box helicase family protein [Helicobacter pullorum]